MHAFAFRTHDAELDSAARVSAMSDGAYFPVAFREKFSRRLAPKAVAFDSILLSIQGFLALFFSFTENEQETCVKAWSKEKEFKGSAAGITCSQIPSTSKLIRMLIKQCSVVRDFRW